MIIKNASVYTEEGYFQIRDIFIEGDRFTDGIQGVSDRTEVDASGCYAIPGLTDIHFHGCGGYDFCDGTREALDRMAKYEAEHGVTNMIPATMTLPEDMLLNIFKNAGEYPGERNGEEQDGKEWNRTERNGEGQDGTERNRTERDGKRRERGRARLQGIYMEGPFISMAKKGAQNGAYIRKADVELFERLNRASGGTIKFVAIAPEEEGAMEFIGKKHGEVAITLAHTCADYETSMKAFAGGASHVTHLYNAMNPYTHRSPGLIGAAADSMADVELICDGVHVHPSAVRTTFKMFGDNRIILISDSMRATGLGDGEYSLGGQSVRVRGNLAALEDGTIAGSVTNLLDCMRTAVLEMGIPLESAVKCAAVNSARSAGIYEDFGSITPGKKADVVLLRKEDLELRQVIMDGCVL